MTETYCPATMCQLIAADGSPWTGQKNAPCPKRSKTCSWFYERDGLCDAGSGAQGQVAEAADGRHVTVFGPNQPRRRAPGAARDYACPRSSECQWQLDAEKEGGVCAPRAALRLGLDPRLALF